MTRKVFYLVVLFAFIYCANTFSKTRIQRELELIIVLGDPELKYDSQLNDWITFGEDWEFFDNFLEYEDWMDEFFYEETGNAFEVSVEDLP